MMRILTNEQPNTSTILYEEAQTLKNMASDFDTLINGNPNIKVTSEILRTIEALPAPILKKYITPIQKAYLNGQSKYKPELKELAQAILSKLM